MAQLALQIAGAVIGYQIGGPLGAAIGASIGSYVGAVISRETIRGPTLNDLHIQGSSYGTPVPRIWGTFRVGGNVNWRVPQLQSHEHESGGKGSTAPDVISTSYSASYSVKICQGANFLLGIWSNGRWIYDARPGIHDVPVSSSDLPMVFYDGNELQEPDPTEESVEGVGNVPAYLGYQRVVYTDRDVSEFGNVIPQDNYLVSSEGATALPMSRIEGPWDPLMDLSLDTRSAGWDPADTTLIRLGWYTAGSPHVETGNWHNATYTTDGVFVDETVFVIPNSITPYSLQRLPCREDPDSFFLNVFDGSSIQASMFYRNMVQLSINTYDFFGSEPEGHFTLASEFTFLDIGEQRAYYVLCTTFSTHPDGFSSLTIRRVLDGVPSVSDPRQVLATGGSEGGAYIWRNAQNNTLWLFRAGGGGSLYHYDQDLTLIKHYTTLPVTTGTHDGFFCSDASGTEYIVYQTSSGGTYQVTIRQVQDDDSAWPVVTTIPILAGVTIDAGDVQGVWDMGDGVGLVQDGLIAVCARDTGQTLLSVICADVCELCGLTPEQYDVSAIEIPVRGFAACTEGPTAGRGILEAILPAFFVGVAEHDGKLIFRPNARPADVVVPDEDLAARSENGEPPVPLQVTLGNDNEIPQQIYLKYFEPAMDYQIGTQEHHRQNTDSRIVTTVSVPVVFTAKEAKRIVEAWVELALVESDTYAWTTTKKYLRYQPEDIMRVQGIDLRVTKKSVRMAEGIIEWEGKRSHPGISAQPGIGGDAEGFVPPEIVEPQETELALLDIPLPVDVTRQAVVHVAAQGADRVSWKGMSLQKSVDGGTSYNEVLVNVVHDTIGETLTLLPNFGGGHLFDEASILDVLIHPGGGELASTTRRGVLTGSNRAMVGAEMIAYRSAELTAERTYRLTGLLRGLHGSEWAMRGHAVGDLFTVLPTNMVMDGLPSDLGLTRKYKPVTLGRSLTTATAQDFRYNGIALAPYAPVQLAAGFAGDPGAADITLTWRRRTRFGGGWINCRAPTGQDSMPLGETSEAYRVKIYEDGTRLAVVRTIDVSTNSVAYLAADQVIDFGDELTVLPTWGVAQIGALGPGYEAPLGYLPLFVPGDTPGYTPPYPPPSEAVDSTMAWVEATTINSGSFGPTDAWVIQFTTGTTDSAGGGLVRLQGAEYSGPPAPREWTLSPIAGDFGPQAMPGAQGSGSPSVTALFVVGSGTDYGFYPTIPQSTTWYLNIRNLPSGYSDVPMFCTLLNVP